MSCVIFLHFSIVTILSSTDIPGRQSKTNDGEGRGSVLDRSDWLGDRRHVVVGGWISTGKQVCRLWQRLFQTYKAMHLKSKSFCDLSFSLAFWISTEPDDWPGEDPESGEDCANLGSKSQGKYCWFDRTCMYSLRSICEKPGKAGHLICAEM